MVLCPNRHWSRPDANCCTTCGTLLPGRPVPPMGMVSKSALAAEFWRREMAGSHDPSVREFYKRMRNGEGGTA